jgi:hypothetical protein
VPRDGEVRTGANGQKMYYLGTTDKPREGVLVVVYDGKLQSMMPADYRYFIKRGVPIK